VCLCWRQCWSLDRAHTQTHKNTQTCAHTQATAAASLHRELESRLEEQEREWRGRMAMAQTSAQEAEEAWRQECQRLEGVVGNRESETRQLRAQVLIV
jgi:23S rRNA maturation mini-RNase III